MGGKIFTTPLFRHIDGDQGGNHPILQAIGALKAVLIQQPLKLINVGQPWGSTHLGPQIHQQIGQPEGVASLIGNVVGEVLDQILRFTVEGLNQVGEVLAAALLVIAITIQGDVVNLWVLNHLLHHIAGAQGIEKAAGIGHGHGSFLSFVLYGWIVTYLLGLGRSQPNGPLQPPSEKH